MIRLDSVSKRFPDGTIAVTDLTLEVPEGEISVLVGPSGCGKTTTLKMVNRLIEPTSGRIYLDDEDVTGVDPVGLRRRIGYVIQQVGLFPHQTIAGTSGPSPGCSAGTVTGSPLASTSSWSWSASSRRRTGTGTRPSCPVASASG